MKHETVHERWVDFLCVAVSFVVSGGVCTFNVQNAFAAEKPYRELEREAVRARTLNWCQLPVNILGMHGMGKNEIPMLGNIRKKWKLSTRDIAQRIERKREEKHLFRFNPRSNRGKCEANICFLRVVFSTSDIYARH